MREITQVVKHEVDGEEMSFQITKMNALDGAWLIKFASEKLLPLYNQIEGVFAPPKDGENEEEAIQRRTEEVVKMIPAALMSISREDLALFMTSCLSTVCILLDSGWRPVMVDGDFAVEELEYDTMTALVLCYDVMAFNMSGFFGGGRLGSALKRLRT